MLRSAITLRSIVTLSESSGDCARIGDVAAKTAAALTRANNRMRLLSIAVLHDVDSKILIEILLSSEWSTV